MSNLTWVTTAPTQSLFYTKTMVIFDTTYTVSNYHDIMSKLIIVLVKNNDIFSKSRATHIRLNLIL